MHVRTVSVTLAATRELVFNFLADIENLPKWATEFCDQIELRHSGWWAYTTKGEMLVSSEADDRTGVIDLRMGPSAEELGLFPIRVIALREDAALASFTFVQSAELPEALYESQYRGLLMGLQSLLQRFGGGELHSPELAPEFAVLGLN